MTHALTRTSPFGQKFIGTCDKCGREGLGMGDALEPCPMDHIVSNEQALLDTLARDWRYTSTKTEDGYNG